MEGARWAACCELMQRVKCACLCSGVTMYILGLLLLDQFMKKIVHHFHIVDLGVYIQFAAKFIPVGFISSGIYLRVKANQLWVFRLDVFHNIFFVAAAKFEIFKPVHVTDAMSRFHDVFYQGNAGEYGGR